MKRETLFWIMLAAGSGFAGAQTRLDLRTQTKTPDLSALGATSTFQTGATLPATCTSGQSYFLTLAEPGANLFLCASANVWSQIKSAAAGGVRSVTGANDTLQRTDDKMNVIYTGSGAVAVTLPQPGTGGGPGSAWEASVFNSSTNGTLTLTPVGTGIDGYSSVSVPPLQGLSIWSVDYLPQRQHNSPGWHGNPADQQENFFRYLCHALDCGLSGRNRASVLLEFKSCDRIHVHNAHTVFRLRQWHASELAAGRGLRCRPDPVDQWIARGGDCGSWRCITQDRRL